MYFSKIDDFAIQLGWTENGVTRNTPSLWRNVQSSHKFYPRFATFTIPEAISLSISNDIPVTSSIHIDFQGALLEQQLKIVTWFNRIFIPNPSTIYKQCFHEFRENSSSCNYRSFFHTIEDTRFRITIQYIKSNISPYEPARINKIVLSHTKELSEIITIDGNPIIAEPSVSACVNEICAHMNKLEHCYNIHSYIALPIKEGTVWYDSLLHELRAAGYHVSIHHYSFEKAVQRISVEHMNASDDICDPSSQDEYVAIHKNMMNERLSLINSNDSFSDVVMVLVDEPDTSKQRIKLHKAILAAHSDVWKREFCISMKETTTSEFNVCGVNAEVMNAFLKFIYGGRCEACDIGSNFVDLYELARLYQVRTLQQQLSYYWQKSMSSADAAHAYYMASISNDKKLEIAAKQFIFEHANSVEKSTCFNDMKNICSSDIISAISLQIEEGKKHYMEEQQKKKDSIQKTKVEGMKCLIKLMMLGANYSHIIIEQTRKRYNIEKSGVYENIIQSESKPMDVCPHAVHTIMSIKQHIIYMFRSNRNMPTRSHQFRFRNELDIYAKHAVLFPQYVEGCDILDPIERKKMVAVYCFYENYSSKSIFQSCMVVCLVAQDLVRERNLLFIDKDNRFMPLILFQFEKEQIKKNSSGPKTFMIYPVGEKQRPHRPKLGYPICESIKVNAANYLCPPAQEVCMYQLLASSQELVELHLSVAVLNDCEFIKLMRHSAQLAYVFSYIISRRNSEANDNTALFIPEFAMCNGDGDVLIFYNCIKSSEMDANYFCGYYTKSRANIKEGIDGYYLKYTMANFEVSVKNIHILSLFLDHDDRISKCYYKHMEEIKNLVVHYGHCTSVPNFYKILTFQQPDANRLPLIPTKLTENTIINKIVCDGYSSITAADFDWLKKQSCIPNKKQKLY